jgi:hypothetical protein
MSLKRDNLNGVWILDKSREPWSMNDYLRTMNVDPLAIEAHEKGEKEFETYNTIELTDQKVKIIKRSRVNCDLEVELNLDQEQVDILPPGNRPKRMMATSLNPGHLQISSSLLTVNGMALVTDIKTLQHEEERSVMCQELTIVNEQTGQSHKTTRYFLPFLTTPPKLFEDQDDAP